MRGKFSVRPLIDERTDVVPPPKGEKNSLTENFRGALNQKRRFLKDLYIVIITLIHIFAVINNKLNLELKI